MRKSADIADTVWPAVERAIRGRLPVPEVGLGVQPQRMVDWFAGAVIWDVARRLDAAGVRIPEEC